MGSETAVKPGHTHIPFCIHFRSNSNAINMVFSKYLNDFYNWGQTEEEFLNACYVAATK